MTGLPGYAYLVEAGTVDGLWQKVGVAAGRGRVEQHRGWRPVVLTVRPGYRLADPRRDVEKPVLDDVWKRGESRPTIADPTCPDCGTRMPDLPASGHTEAWHVACRQARTELFVDLLERARLEHGYPDNSLTQFLDGALEPHGLESSNGRLVHVGEYPQLPRKSEYVAHVATSFYVSGVAADRVLDALTTAALSEPNLIRFLIESFRDGVRKMDGLPLRKASGSGGMNRRGQVQERLDEISRLPELTVGFINDRVSGMLHAFAEPALTRGPLAG